MQCSPSGLRGGVVALNGRTPFSRAALEGTEGKGQQINTMHGDKNLLFSSLKNKHTSI